MPHEETIDLSLEGLGIHYGDDGGFGEQEMRQIRFPEKMRNAYEYGYAFCEQPFRPLYVNARQLNWIKKRKSRRDLLDSLMVSSKNNYLHESRHRHAMKRLRAPSGRFLTKEESEDFRRRRSAGY